MLNLSLLKYELWLVKYSKCCLTVLFVFHTSEVAFGYKGLQIQIYYTAGNLSTLFKVKYTTKVTETFDCVQVG